MATRTPKALVAAYEKEATPLERRGDGGPEQLKSGAEIMALDDASRAEAIIEAYARLPTTSTFSYGRTIMLGLLATTLLRKRLPLEESDFVAMAEHAARAHGPAWGPCDYDFALAKAIAKSGVRPSPKLKRALRDLTKRRGRGCAMDRKVCAACDAIISA